MAAIGLAVTLQDLARRTDPDGKFSMIVELVNKTNEITEDMMFVEANQTKAHVTTVRTGLPTATWRKLNYGVQTSKSQTVQVSDTIGMLEAYAEVDKDLVEMSADPAAFRLSEDKAFLESMNQTMATTLFYGDETVNPERFTGLAPRYATISADEEEIGSNIISAGGVGADNTSIWLVVWGANTVHGTYPKGSQAGFRSENLGQVTLQDAAGGNYEGYRTHYKWDMGFSLRDWRYVVRIANIDISDLTKDAATGADLVDLMTQALELVQDLTSGNPAFYVNRTVRSFLRRQIRNSNNVNLTMEEVAGKKVLAFDAVPVRMSDAILKTESVVS